MATLSKGKIQKTYAETVFLDYITKHPDTEESNCPSFLKEELQIGNFRSYAQKLVRGGKLKEKDKRYMLTEAGEKFLTENRDYLRFFAQGSPYLTIWEYVGQKGERHADDFVAIMTELFEKKSKAMSGGADDGAMKDIHLDLGALYEEQGLPETALEHYLTVLYCDVSGLEYAAALDNYINRKLSKDKTRKKFDGVYLRPAARAGIRRTKEAYTPELAERICAQYPIENNLCSKEKFLQLVQDVMGDGELDEKGWQEYFAASFTAVLNEAEKHRVPAKNGGANGEQKAKGTHHGKRQQKSRMIIPFLLAVIVLLGAFAVYRFLGDRIADLFRGSEIIAEQTEPLTLDRKELTLSEGESKKITVSGAESVQWSSSDTSVATVTDGTVTAVKSGSTTVTATAGDTSVSCAVTVRADEENEQSKLAIGAAWNGKPLDKRNGKYDVTLQGYDAAVQLLVIGTDSPVTWASEDANIVEVSSDGTLHRVAEGTVDVTATVDGQTLTCIVRS